MQRTMMKVDMTQVSRPAYDSRGWTTRKLIMPHTARYRHHKINETLGRIDAIWWEVPIHDGTIPQCVYMIHEIGDMEVLPHGADADYLFSYVVSYGAIQHVYLDSKVEILK